MYAEQYFRQGEPRLLVVHSHPSFTRKGKLHSSAKAISVYRRHSRERKGFELIENRLNVFDDGICLVRAFHLGKLFNIRPGDKSTFFGGNDNEPNRIFRPDIVDTKVELLQNVACQDISGTFRPIEVEPDYIVVVLFDPPMFEFIVCHNIIIPTLTRNLVERGMKCRIIALSFTRVRHAKLAIASIPLNHHGAALPATYTQGSHRPFGIFLI